MQLERGLLRVLLGGLAKSGSYDPYTEDHDRSDKR